MERNENKTTEIKKGFSLKGAYERIVTAESGKGLAIRVVLLLLIPYLYLWLCGLVFDLLLRWYGATTFIFVTLMIFWAVDIVLAIIAIARYVKRKKG